MLEPTYTKEGFPDHILVTELKAGDEEAFKALLVKHQDFANVHAYRLTHHRRKALALATLSLEYLWKCKDKIPVFYESPAAPPFWLFIAKVIHAYFDALKEHGYEVDPNKMGPSDLLVSPGLPLN